MSDKELIIPAGMKNIYAEKKYAPGVRVGNMLYVSGMLGRDASLSVIDDPEAQFVQLFETMNSVLDAANATL